MSLHDPFGQSGAPHLPADHDVRARARDVSRPLALVAGAGAGKTSVLVDRVAAALERHPARLIAAVTFTEKAAAEIRHRVRTKFDASRSGELSQLTVTTLHGFARKLLLEEAFAAGFPPGADISGSKDSDVVRGVVDGVVGAFVRKLRRDDRALWRLLDALVTPFQLRRALDVLIGAPGFTLDAAPTSSIVELSLVSLQDHRKAIRTAVSECSSVDDKLLLAWGDIDDAFADAFRVSAAELVVNAALRKKFVRRGLGTKKSWTGDSRDRVYAAVDALLAWQKQTRALAHGAILRRLADDAVPTLVREREKRGLVSFDDLLLQARDVLVRDPQARARLQERFKVVLIDEVQDTDPLQAEITSLLTKDLFVVGDPKQAIFRFRGGDIESFTATARLVDDRATLASNFRSVRGVVDWCNHTFALLPAFTPQVAVRGAGPLPAVVVVDAAPDDAPAAVAAHLRSLIDARSIAPRDVMVVLPSWAAADDVADAFAAAGIPAVIEGGDRLFARDEMRLALATLRAIVDGSDTEAVCFCLRGVFGATLEELWNHKSAGRSFRPVVVDAVKTPAPTRLQSALDRLARASRRTGTMSLARLVEDVLWGSALPAWARFHDADRRRANVDRFFALVEAHEQEVRAPLEVVRALINEATREDHTDVRRLDDDGTAARITTLFSAKGLEAPVVVVMAQERKRDHPAAVLDRLRRTASIKLGALEPPGWDDAVARDQLLDDEERRRWVYVACTRARDQLVLAAPFDRLLGADVAARGLPGDLSVVASDTDVVVGDTTGGPAIVRVVRPVVATAAHPVWITEAPAPATGGSTLTSPIAEVVKRARTASRRWRTVSEVAAQRRLTVDVVVDEGSEEQGVGAVGGRLVHKVMERLDFNLPTEMRVAAARQLAKSMARAAFVDPAGADGVVDRVASVVDRLARHAVVERAAKAQRIWREVPFALPSADRRRTVAGTIDLVFEDATAVVVVDWKSHVPAPGTALRARYEAQLAEYVRAVVTTIDPKKPIEAVLAGPHKELPPDLFEFDDDDGAYASLDEDVRAVVEAVAAVVGAPVVGYIDVSGVECVVAWPDRKVALVDDNSVDVPGFLTTSWADALPGLLGVVDDGQAD